MFTGKRRTARRSIASVALALTIAAAPTAAFGEDESDNIWVNWAGDVLDREDKFEVPAAVVFSLPAMLLITPIWLGQLALGALRGSDDGDDE